MAMKHKERVNYVINALSTNEYGWIVPDIKQYLLKLAKDEPDLVIRIVNILVKGSDHDEYFRKTALGYKWRK